MKIGEFFIKKNTADFIDLVFGRPEPRAILNLGYGMDVGSMDLQYSIGAGMSPLDKPPAQRHFLTIFDMRRDGAPNERPRVQFCFTNLSAPLTDYYVGLWLRSGWENAQDEESERIVECFKTISNCKREGNWIWTNLPINASFNRGVLNAIIG